MTTHTRFTFMAGALAAAALLAGCQRDRTAGPTGPGATSAQVVGSNPAGSTQTLFDATDTDGRHYTVRRVLDASGHAVATDHFVDGVLFAEATPAAQGVSVAAYADGALADNQLVSLADRSLTISSSTPFSDAQSIMLMPCTDELRAYLTASVGLIAAGAYLERYRASRKAITTFAAAVANFIAAWNDLYNCESVHQN